MKAAVIGASGYIGGELLRLLLGHPRVELVQATSDRLAGQPLHVANPNLRGATTMNFTRHEEIAPCDALFISVPHGVTKHRLREWKALAPRVIDLTADFRLGDPAVYEAYYGEPHPNPEFHSLFVPGLPELHRERLKTATYVTMPGCMANAAILALYPLAEAGLLTREVLVDCLTGSSGSGGTPTLSTHHAERSGVMRVFRPVGHRHEAEISQACSAVVRMTAVSVEAVRGVLVIGHVSLERPLENKDVWSIYRRRYGAEPFVRLVKQKVGLHQLPEPKILLGSNFCDIGFALSEDRLHLVLVSALDNLVKGGAGNAVQCLNIACGWDERDGLKFTGLHPA